MLKKVIHSSAEVVDPEKHELPYHKCAICGGYMLIAGMYMEYNDLICKDCLNANKKNNL